MVRRAIEEFGRLDIVVNCAGVIRDRMSWNLTDDDWDVVHRTHLRGSFLVNRAATPYLRAGERCHIVNFSSSAGVIGNVGSANYAAAKAGILGLTKVLALELARDGVAVNAIVPFAWTRMAEVLPGQDTERVQRLRSLKPSHIAHFVAALVACDRPGWSGQIFGIRGAEVMVFSQIRPTLRLARSGGWDADTLLESGFAALNTGLVPLQSSLEIFDYDTLV
jgi:NAD(P)-dependent dehydrogenase (short-subunit alcohol dehydrogenase family)